jgi:hypothetical protein
MQGLLNSIASFVKGTGYVAAWLVLVLVISFVGAIVSGVAGSLLLLALLYWQPIVLVALLLFFVMIAIANPRR